MVGVLDPKTLVGGFSDETVGGESVRSVAAAVDAVVELMVVVMVTAMVGAGGVLVVAMGTEHSSLGSENNLQVLASCVKG